MSKFTPGPWKSIGCVIRSVFGRTATTDVFNKRIPWAQRKANAHLISAAPDMYEALKSLVAAQDNSGMHENEKQWISAMVKSNKALAKADGK
jgi:hypothetical protein